MDPTALGLAYNRFAAALDAYDRLKTATSYVEAEFAWSSFIAAVNTIYSKLEKGSKTNGSSSSWFGRKKSERKKDSLLRYLHYARNCDEHGIQFVTHRNMPMFGEEPAFSNIEQTFGKQIPIKIQKLDPITKEPVGNWINGTVEGPNIILVRVTDDRFQDSCDPPKEHLGQPIEKPSPQLVAELAIKYIKRILDEAQTLPISPTRTE